MLNIRRSLMALAGIIFFLMCPSLLPADEIVITEIMYDPASDDRWPAKSEWVEIYNRSDRTISIAGWYLANERGQTHPIGDGIEMAPGEAVVIVPGNQTAADFHAAWGEGYQVIPLRGWHMPGLHQLTNEPTAEDGILTLRRTAGDVADEVNYRNEDRWPPSKPDGPSIYLLPHVIDTTSNDDGANWVRSEAGRHGARQAEPEGGYDVRDLGSPGVVVIAEEEEEGTEAGE